jgi:hypothetical protein
VVLMAAPRNNSYRVESGRGVHAGLPVPPPYAVPTAAGEVVAIGSNTVFDVRPPGWSQSEISEIFNNFGGGVFSPDYSPTGAYVFTCTGGHNHPDHANAIIFDFTDATWKRLLHTNGGRQYGSNTNEKCFEIALDTNGDPWFEIVDSVQVDGGVTYAVPIPGHPYQSLVYRSPADGGGPKGAVLAVTRAAIGFSWGDHARTTHELDLATMRWRRVTNNLYPHGMGYEMSAIWDSARQRIWYVPGGAGVNQLQFQVVNYLRVSDWTWQASSPPWAGFLPSPGFDGALRTCMYQGKVLMQGNNGVIYVFDPDAPSVQPYPLTMSGPSLTALQFHINRIEYYPPTDSFYFCNWNPGSTLYRLKINLAAGTCAVTTVTLGTSLPQTGGAGDQADQYYFLFYVPALQRLAWIHSEVGSVYLINPE